MAHRIKAKIIILVGVVGLLIGSAQAALVNHINFTAFFTAGNVTKMTRLVAKHNEIVEPGESTMLSISSPGGLVYTLDIAMKALDDSKVRINTFIPEFAASCGAMLFLAGESRVMKEDAIIMFHYPSNRTMTSHDLYGMLGGYIPDLYKYLYALFTFGGYEGIEKAADDLRKLDEKFMRDLVKIIGKSAAEKVLRHGHDTFMTAREALAAGIATHIID